MSSAGMKRLGLAGLPLLVCLVIGPNASPGPVEDGEAADVKFLKDAGIATDEAGLVALFKKQTPNESQRRQIGELIKQLGDDDFQVRETATRELKGLGNAARAALQNARNHEDPEVVRRVTRCLNALADGSNDELLACAARVLSARKSAQGVDVLLAFLPTAASSEIEEAIIRAVTVLGVSEAKGHPTLVRALTDELPLRRAAAGEALAGLPVHAESVRKLLQDVEPSVRLRVSLALVCSGDRNAVPVFIDCLPQLTRDQAWQVGDILVRLGWEKAPWVPAGEGAVARTKYRDECNAWWKEHGAKADLTRLEGGPRRRAKMTARASQTWAHPEGESITTPANAVDGDLGTVWNAGVHPPPDGAWIEVDVRGARQLGGLFLGTSQSPDGPTTHEIWVSTAPIGDDRTKAQLVHTFKGATRTGELLRFEFPKRLSGRYVQIRTTESPSWVSWTEVELGVR